MGLKLSIKSCMIEHVRKDWRKHYAKSDRNES